MGGFPLRRPASRQPLCQGGEIRHEFRFGGRPQEFDMVIIRLVNHGIVLAQRGFVHTAAAGLNWHNCALAGFEKGCAQVLHFGIAAKDLSPVADGFGFEVCEERFLHNGVRAANEYQEQNQR